MRILQSFSPEYSSSGLTTINLNVRGTLQQPRIRGRIQISDGAISYVDLPNGLSGINGTLIFTEDRLQVQKLSAHTGGGDLRYTAFSRYRAIGQAPSLVFEITVSVTRARGSCTDRNETPASYPSRRTASFDAWSQKPSP